MKCYLIYLYLIYLLVNVAAVQHGIREECASRFSFLKEKVATCQSLNNLVCPVALESAWTTTNVACSLFVYLGFEIPILCSARRYLSVS